MTERCGSFPYFNIARDNGVSYSAVLRAVEYLDDDKLSPWVSVENGNEVVDGETFMKIMIAYAAEQVRQIKSGLELK